MPDVKLADISGKKETEYLKAKMYDLETNSKKEISETCIAASVTFRRVTSLELI
jgi:hypothetical protein